MKYFSSYIITEVTILLESPKNGIVYIGGERIMIAIFCIIATFLSVLFAIMYRHKYPGYSILAVAIIPATAFYVLGKYQYTEVFIGFAIFYCLFGYILTMKKILLNH